MLHVVGVEESASMSGFRLVQFLRQWIGRRLETWVGLDAWRGADVSRLGQTRPAAISQALGALPDFAVPEDLPERLRLATAEAIGDPAATYGFAGEWLRPFFEGFEQDLRAAALPDGRVSMVRAFYCLCGQLRRYCRQYSLEEDEVIWSFVPFWLAALQPESRSVILRMGAWLSGQARMLAER